MARKIIGIKVCYYLINPEPKRRTARKQYSTNSESKERAARKQYKYHPGRNKAAA